MKTSLQNIMKKIPFILLLLGITSALSAQSFLKKLKNKVAEVVDKPVSTAAGPASSQDSDPFKFGKVIKTYTKKEIEAHMGGESGGSFGFYFTDMKVVNNQLQFKVAEPFTQIYSYDGSKLVGTGQKPDDDHFKRIYNGSEYDMASKDFTSLDYEHSIMHKPAIQSTMALGKVNKTFTFKGKQFGTFIMGAVSHNADSSVVGVMGTSYSKGVVYTVVTSSGINYTVPTASVMSPIISPNGKFCAAMVQDTKGISFYVSNGTKVDVGGWASDGLWIRDSGSIFTIDGQNSANLNKNGKPYYTFDLPIDKKLLFISADEKTMCWSGRGIYFSDGTKFENGSSPQKVILNGKEVIVFLVVDLQKGDLYLCQHDL